MEATKTVAKYERVGEPQRMRLLNHMSNAHCALPLVRNELCLRLTIPLDSEIVFCQSMCDYPCGLCALYNFPEKVLVSEALIAHTAGHS